MASAPSPVTARTAPTLPVEILEDIFLRLHEAADLTRASAVCSSFRSAACSRGFLRRFHSLHPPPVLGVLDSEENHGVLLHAEPPHRFAPATRALAQAADFSFSFVPRDPNYGDGVWRVWDALDGLVLLSMNRYTNIVFEDLVVCDPLHHRNNTLDLYCKTLCNNDAGVEGWQHKIIPLPETGYPWYIKGAGHGYLLLKAIRKGSQIPREVVYILEVKTSLFERLPVSKISYHSSFFASFPPPLSLPTI